MRVALDVSSAAKAHRTGVGHYVARLADALLAADPALELTLGVRLGRWSRRAHRYRPPATAAGRTRSRWFASAWPSLSLPGVDVAHGPDARLVGGPAAQVVTVHDLFNLKSSQYADEAFREEKRDRYAEAAERAARILCVSEATARDVASLLRVDPARLAVTPLGVDPAFRPLPEAEAAPTLRRLGVTPPYALFVGLAQPRKNLEAVANVFARLNARLDDLSLVLAGDDGYPEGRLATLLKSTGVVSKIRLLGYTAAEDLPALYSGARVLLFPSRDEGFGLPALEAMACGCPVVASDRGALPEVLGPGGYCVGPDALDDLEDAARRMLEDEDLRAAEVARGLARAREFSWERTAKATLAAYRAAAEGSRSPAGRSARKTDVR